MAFDLFIKIDGIEGESSDEKHSGWIELASVNWGLSNEGQSQQHPTKTTRWSEFVFTKVVDSSSPKLFQACDSGTKIKEILLEACRSGGDKMKYVEYKFSTCYINRISLSSGENTKETLPLETISFKFKTVQFTYFKQKRQDGLSGGQISSFFDLSARGSGE